MSRWLHKSWQDRRPGWRRRVRWYRGEFDVRLNIIDLDEGREANLFYRSEDDALAAYHAFIGGARVVDLMDVNARP